MALHDMNEALEQRTSASFLSNRAVVHLCLGDASSAMTDLRAAIDMDPTHSLAYTNAVHVYIRRRQLAQALDFCDKALALTPTDETALANRAIARCLHGVANDASQAHEALTDFDAAVKLSPGSAYLWYNRACLLMHLGRWPEAESDLRQCIQLDPSDADAHAQLAKALGHQHGKTELALQEQAISAAL